MTVEKINKFQFEYWISIFHADVYFITKYSKLKNLNGKLTL